MEINLKEMTNEELNELLNLIQDELKNRQTKKYELHLFSNQYKGSGKCWVAEIDELKKIKKFVEPYNVIKDGYKREKIFLLSDGIYLYCQEGTKSYDEKKYFTIKNGEYIEGI